MLYSEGRGQLKHHPLQAQDQDSRGGGRVRGVYHDG